MKTVLEAKNVWKIYDTGSNKVEALRDVSISINKGEMVAVMGPSGCGKTTFLNCLSGLDDLTSGEVIVDKSSLFGGGDEERTRLRAEHFGFIFQDFNLLPVLTALENVEMPLQLIKSYENRKSIRSKALDALDSVGLRDWSGHRPSELSGGQKQRVTIARAFVHKPAVILGDEPTGNLDSKTSNQIMDLLFDFNSKYGITMLIVTHDSEVASRCNRILEMDDGRIVSDYSKAEEE